MKLSGAAVYSMEFQPALFLSESRCEKGLFMFLVATNEKTHFAPELHIPNGTSNIDFYMNFGATEHFCFRNEDGSIHVAELDINGAIFHLHETSAGLKHLNPSVQKE